MAYIEKRYYVCSICGEKAEGQIMFSTYSAPKWWAGGDGADDQCFCECCYKAIKQLSNERKQKKRKGKSEEAR